ncbi:glycosyltransferase [Plantactinospora sp. CA-294935]|uniref:glycosyltransferase n=1 Tax=Plantactinospora sp. CA-294935 TaxID=3240012 RepID=UPI003D8A83E8
MSAAVLLSRGQLAVLAATGVLAAVVLTVAGVYGLLRTLMTLMIAAYVSFTVFKLIVWFAGARRAIPDRPLPSLDDPALPTYTVLVPLYQEAAVLPGLITAITRIRYPTERMQVLLLLETGDDETIETVRRTALPSYVTAVIVPDAGPRTKPKACNYAMTVATGEFTVIFDAEDRPEPDHLLKAVAAMWAERRSDPRVICVQGILSFWNPRSGIPSVFYWAEYVAHFHWMLVGLCRLGLIPPLCGSSNHFRTEALRHVAEEYGTLTFGSGDRAVTVPSVWDSYNVTEDADLAARLARLDYRVAMCPARTYEEAPHRLSVALRQRTRWLQGYLVTGLVQSRRPLRSIRSMGAMRYLVFIMMMLWTPISALLNPIIWALSATYVLARISGWPVVATFIDDMFPTPVHYVGLIAMVAGNVALGIQSIVTTLYATSDRDAGLAKYLSLTFLWWAFTSLPAYRAAWRLLTARSTWEKTPHGHDQSQEQSVIRPTAPTVEPVAETSRPRDESGLVHSG